MECPLFHDGTDIVSALEHLTCQQILEACVEVPLQYCQKRSRETLIVAIHEASLTHQQLIQMAASAIEGARKRPAGSDWKGVQAPKRRKIDRGDNTFTDTNSVSSSGGSFNQTSGSHVDTNTDIFMGDNPAVSASVRLIQLLYYFDLVFTGCDT
jgi:hypothetical protein